MRTCSSLQHRLLRHSLGGVSLEEGVKAGLKGRRIPRFLPYSRCSARQAIFYPNASVASRHAIADDFGAGHPDADAIAAVNAGTPLCSGATGTGARQTGSPIDGDHVGPGD